MSFRKVYINLDDDSDIEQTTDNESDSGHTTDEDKDFEFEDKCDLSCQSKNGFNCNDIRSTIPVKKSRDKMSDDSDCEFIDWCDFPSNCKLNSELKDETESSTTFAVNTVSKSSSYFYKDFGDKKDFKTDNKQNLKGKDLKRVLKLYEDLDIDKRSKQITKKDRKRVENIEVIRGLDQNILSVDKSVKKVDKKVNKLINLKLRKDIDKNVIKTDKCLQKVENTSKKFIKNEFKNGVNAGVDAFVPTPSTSRADPICETSNQNDVYLPLSSVQMKDESTDPRFYCRPSNSNSISLTDQISIASNEDNPSNNISTEVEKIWVYICLKCSKRFETRKNFCEHHLKVHSGHSMGFKKMDKSLLDVNQSSVPKKKKKVKRRHKNLFESSLKSSDSVPKIKSNTKSKETINGLINCKNKKFNNKTNKRESNTKRTLSNANLSSGQTSTPRVFDGLNHYRLLQKCKICSFTPVVSSMKSIEEHIQKEHNIQEDIGSYHMSVMVQFKPK